MKLILILIFASLFSIGKIKGNEYLQEKSPYALKKYHLFKLRIQKWGCFFLPFPFLMFFLCVKGLQNWSVQEKIFFALFIFFLCFCSFLLFFYIKKRIKTLEHLMYLDEFKESQEKKTIQDIGNKK